MAFNTSGYSPEQQQMFQPYQLGPQGMQAVKPRSAVGTAFLGEQEQFQRTPTQTPQAMQFLRQILAQAGEGLQDPSAGFDPIRRDVTRQFNEETIPGLSEQFTAGVGGGTSSPAFQNRLGQAGAGLGERLAAMQAKYGLENRQGLLQQAQLGLTPQFETKYKPRGQGLLEKGAEIGLQGLSAAAGNFGGGLGNMLSKRAFGESGDGDIKSLLKNIFSAS